MNQPSQPAGRPSILFVYFSYTKQTLKVVEAMAEVLRGRGCDVTLAAIGFTDPRYAGRFGEFPMPHPFRELAGMIPAESPRRRPATIVIPDAVTEREYDLVCIGSPTWWLSTDVPVRSFLQSGTTGRVLAGKPFAVAVCCRLCYLGPGTYRERYPGVKIPPAGIQDYHLQTARKLAGEPASRVAGAGVPH
jgi:flavodoxin